MQGLPYRLTDHARKRVEERHIDEKWITRVIVTPEMEFQDSDDSSVSHAFSVVPEYGNNVLHVVCNKTLNPWVIISVYFDRKYKGKL